MSDITQAKPPFYTLTQGAYKVHIKAPNTEIIYRTSYGGVVDIVQTRINIIKRVNPNWSIFKINVNNTSRLITITYK